MAKDDFGLPNDHSSNNLSIMPFAALLADVGISDNPVRIGMHAFCVIRENLLHCKPIAIKRFNEFETTRFFHQERNGKRNARPPIVTKN